MCWVDGMHACNNILKNLVIVSCLFLKVNSCCFLILLSSLV
jgi:hypothetical protein